MKKVVVVTGAGKGIGRAASLQFAREGASLSVISRTTRDLIGLKKEFSSSVRA